MCQNCEYNSPKYLGRCPNCGAWSSFVEEVEVAEVKNARVSLTGEKTKPMKLAEVTSINVNRTKTEMEEFNRVLGGGVVPGSLVLIGGDPGIGKSTLLLQVSTQLSQVGTVLYVSGEESAQQIKLRAERLGDIDSEFYLYAETNMQSVRAEVERIQPDFPNSIPISCATRSANSLFEERANSFKSEKDMISSGIYVSLVFVTTFSIYHCSAFFSIFQ